MATRLSRRRLGDVLLEQGLISEEQLKECIQTQRTTGQSLPNILVQRGYLAEEDLVVTLSEQLGIPHIRVAHYNIPKEVLKEVPESLARQYQMLPVSVTGDVLTLAMADPLNIMALDDLRMLTSYEIEPVVALMSELVEAIERNYGAGRQGADLYAELVESEESAAGTLEVVSEDEGVQDIATLEAAGEEEPVKRLVNLIMLNALEVGATDIHLEPYEKILRVRYRVDGALEEAKSPPKSMQAKLTARLKILSKLRIDEHRRPQDGRFRTRFKGRDIDFRIAFLPCYYGEKVVMRILDKSAVSLDFEKLGFEEQPMQAFTEALKLPHGMILVTGPTGSGKTTTLYSALHRLNTIDVNIVTVEDPIEYELFGINQVQVHQEIDFTFGSALRQILRQDPDIVMVGEMRDEETGSTAIRAALTGHLVLSTLHTNDSAGVFPRLIDMNIEPFLVQSSVVLASAQRLVRSVCPECKEPIKVPAEVLQRIQYKPSSDAPPPQFVRGRGCSRCKETGYKGRLAVIEAMPNYPEIGEMIMKRAPGSDIKKIAVSCGMSTLRQNALAKAARGLTTIEQVLEHTGAD